MHAINGPRELLNVVMAFFKIIPKTSRGKTSSAFAALCSTAAAASM